MAWIESHQDLASHPKTKRAARLLGVSVPVVVGHLHMLWWWALDHAQDGDLTDFDGFDLTDAVQWDGDPDVFVDALVHSGPGGKSGFLERDEDGLRIHDWWTYAGRLIESRQHNETQKRKHRELYNDRALCRQIRRRDNDCCRYCGKDVNWKDRRGPDGATYDYIDPEGPTELANLAVACRSCNAAKGKRLPEEAGMTLQGTTGRTQMPVEARREPTPTEPNPTEENQGQTPPSPDGDEPDEVEQRFNEHFWPVYPPRNGKKAAKGKALVQFRKLTIEQQRRAVIGARNLAASDTLPKDAHRFLRRDTSGEFPFDDWQTPAARDGPALRAVGSHEHVDGTF